MKAVSEYDAQTDETTYTVTMTTSEVAEFKQEFSNLDEHPENISQLTSLRLALAKPVVIL